MKRFTLLESMRADLEKLYVQDQELRRAIDRLRDAIRYVEIRYVEQNQRPCADVGSIVQPVQKESEKWVNLFYMTGQVAQELHMSQKRVVHLCDKGLIWCSIAKGGVRRIAVSEVERLRKEGVPAASSVPSTSEPHRKQLSATGRKNISAAAQKRWAAFRRQKAAAKNKGREPLHGMGEAGRKRVAAAQRKRWAEYHNQGSSRIRQILEAVGSKHTFSITDLREDENLRKVIPAAFLKTAVYSTLGRAVKRGVLTHEGNGVYRIN
jgi:hypothetical protein